MSDGMPTPDDFAAEDGWDNDAGIEICADCGKELGGPAGYLGPVYDRTGHRYEAFLNTDPVDLPFFCPDCWPELEAGRKASENQSLEEFA